MVEESNNIVSPSGFAAKTFIPLKQAFGENFVQDFVDDIDPKNRTVHLRRGNTLPYDALVIATGSSGPFPGKIDLNVNRADAIARYEHIVERVCSSTLLSNLVDRTRLTLNK